MSFYEVDLHSLNHFEANSNFNSGSRTEWIGIDKYQKIIYGFQYITEEQRRGGFHARHFRKGTNNNIWKETLLIKKLNLFTERIEIIKMFVFEYKKLTIDDSYTLLKASSTDGTVLGILVVSFQREYRISECYHRKVKVIDFYVVFVESGLLRLYKANNVPMFSEDLADGFDKTTVQLIHSNKIGWIIKFTDLSLLVSEDDIKLQSKYYRIVEDETNRTFQLELFSTLVHPGNTTSFTNDICLEDKLVTVFGQSLHFYDFHSSQTTTRKLSEEITVNLRDYAAFGCSLYQLYLASKFDCTMLKYNPNIDLWEISPLSKREVTDEIMPNPFIIGLAATNFIVIFFVDVSLVDRNFLEVYSSDLFVKHFDVSTLKDFCMIALWKKYRTLFRSLNETEICNLLRIPHSLSRQYFGPEWSLDATASCRTANSTQLFNLIKIVRLV